MALSRSDTDIGDNAADRISKLSTEFVTGPERSERFDGLCDRTPRALKLAFCLDPGESAIKLVPRPCRTN
jgi:hypothetical protein